MSEASSSVSGVLPRAHKILTAIAAAGQRGVRLKDLADRTGIARPTVHRMLQDLSDIGFVSQRDDRQYTLGPELFWLGLAAPYSQPWLPAVRALADDLARLTRDTVYVSMREAGGVRYLARAEGDYPLQSRVVSVGDLKPFTSSYSGLALLAGLAPETQEAALQHIVVDAAAGDFEPERLEKLMREALHQVHSQGWCTGPGLVMPGLSGIAAPVPHAHGPACVAVSISAAEFRLTPERAAELAPALLEAARAMGAVIAASE